MGRVKIRWGPALLPRLRSEIVRDALGIVDRMDLLGHGAEAAGLDADEIRRQARTIWDRLRHADMVWVTHDMAAAALDASHDLPLVDTESAPWQSGLMVFERPLPSLPTLNRLTLQDGSTWTDPTPVCAITWHYTAASLIVTRYCRRGTLRVQDGELQAVSAIQVGRGRTLDLSSLTTLPTVDEHPPDDLRLLTFLGAAWAMMMTPTVVQRRALDPATGAVTRTDGPPATDPRRVTLIDLRPMRNVDADREPGESGRVYRHRWVVRGHWREQPHGPGRELRRTTWIPTYTKGPAGAPLLATEKVLVWRR